MAAATGSWLPATGELKALSICFKLLSTSCPTVEQFEVITLEVGIIWGHNLGGRAIRGHNMGGRGDRSAFE